MRRAYVLGVGIRTFGKYPSQTLGTNQIQRVLIARGHLGDLAR
jgi:hypothetical protein